MKTDKGEVKRKDEDEDGRRARERREYLFEKEGISTEVKEERKQGEEGEEWKERR